MDYVSQKAILALFNCMGSLASAQKGNEIPLAGRIVKVADIYDALRLKRSYKPAMSHERVLNIFCNGDPRISPDEHFDPAVLRTFFRFERVMSDIYKESGPCQMRGTTF